MLQLERALRTRPNSGEPDRLMGLDAARGAAMSLVCLAHFQDAYLLPLGTLGGPSSLGAITRAATPSFVLISGFILGFLFHTKPDGFDRVRRKLIDRALFLLTFARVAIIAAHVPIVGLMGALDMVFVTDTIAVCVLVGTVVVPAVGARGRALLGLVLYAAASFAVFDWMPRPGSAAQVLKHLLVGHREPGEHSVFLYNFPIVQWLAVYLAATALGERLARLRTEGGHAGFAALIGLGTVLVGAGSLLWSLRSSLQRLTPFDGIDEEAALAFVTSPLQKLPPGPDYLGVYLGVALFLVTVCIWLERAEPGSVLLKALAVLGRNSLFVFVAQYYVYYSVIFSLHLAYTSFWPLIFAASFLLVIPATIGWQRADGQRLLTVGYPALAVWIGRPRGVR